MAKKLSFKSIGRIIKNCCISSYDDNIASLSASLAYFIIFSLGPLLVITIVLFDPFFSRGAAESHIFQQLQNFVGKNTAPQLEQIVKSTFIPYKSTLAVVIGSIWLLIGATSVFAEIQDSINRIWGLKPKPKSGLLKYLKNRFLSFSVIIGLGFLLLVSFAVSTLIGGFDSWLKEAYPAVTQAIFYTVSIVVTLIVTTVIFGVIFKVLPDAKIKWKDVAAGAITASVLFVLGKFVITFYISKTVTGSTYGTGASLVILLLWTYYVSIILYFGAEFTRAYIAEFGRQILPSEDTVSTRVVEVRKGKQATEKKEKE